MKSNKQKPIAIFLIVIGLGGIYFLKDYVPQELAYNSISTSMTVNEAIDHISNHMNKLESQQNILSDLVEQLFCSEEKVGRTGAFCVSRSQIYLGGNENWDLGVCKGLENLFGESSVLDLGAGLGHYGMCFLRRYHGIMDLGSEKANKEFEFKYLEKMGDYVKEPQIIKSWEGYDGALNIGLISNNFVKTLDLSQKDVWIGHKVDWVMSLEVGEHIPKQYMGNFIDNLVRHACKGIVLTWAIPGQVGYHHVNELPNDKIREEMKLRNLEPDESIEKSLRSAASVRWFKNTIMVYRFKDKYRC